MKSKIAGAVMLVGLSVALTFVGFTAFDHAAASRDVAGEFQDSINASLVEAEANAEIVEIACDASPKAEYVCITLIQNTLTQDVSCAAFLFTLAADGSLPPLTDVYFEALKPKRCGL